MARRVRDYEDWLLERLKDPVEAAAYLNAHLVDDGDGMFEESLMLALGQVARAHGIAAVAERSNLARESLYKTLSGSRDPRLTTLNALLGSLGLKLSIGVKDSEEPVAHP